MKNWENCCRALQSQAEECCLTLTKFFYPRKVQAVRNLLDPSPNLLKRPKPLALCFYFVVKKVLGGIIQCSRNLDTQFRFCFKEIVVLCFAQKMVVALSCWSIYNGKQAAACYVTFLLNLCKKTGQFIEALISPKGFEFEIQSFAHENTLKSYFYQIYYGKRVWVDLDNCWI